MTTQTQSTKQAQTATVKAYVDKIKAQIHVAKAALDLFEAAAQKKKAQAEIAAIGELKTARENIEKRLQDLSGTHEPHVSRAKAAINEEVARFNATINELATKVRSHSATK